METQWCCYIQGHQQTVISLKAGPVSTVRLKKLDRRAVDILEFTFPHHPVELCKVPLVGRGQIALTAIIHDRELAFAAERPGVG